MRKCFIFVLASLLFVPGPAGAAELIEVKKIWDAAPHNAFTDLIRFKGKWFCAFREGKDHVSPDGKLRILQSADGAHWTSAALLSDPRGDARDAKLTVTPQGELTLLGATAIPLDGGKKKHQSVAWFSKDGKNWGNPVDIGEPDLWLWRVTWNKNECYGIGYTTDRLESVRLYRSEDGRKFDVHVPTLHDNSDKKGPPNESSILFRSDGVAHCLLRRDGTPAHGLIGTAKPPYKEWQWRELPMKIGGPHLIQLPDGRLIGAVRLYDGKVRTSLIEINAENGNAKEILTFPSGGDTSYPGLVWHEDRLWVSYYSSHEGKTSIYLAKVKM